MEPAQRRGDAEKEICRFYIMRDPFAGVTIQPENSSLFANSRCSESLSFNSIKIYSELKSLTELYVRVSMDLRRNIDLTSRHTEDFRATYGSAFYAIHMRVIILSRPIPSTEIGG